MGPWRHGCAGHGQVEGTYQGAAVLAPLGAVGRQHMVGDRHGQDDGAADCEKVLSKGHDDVPP